MGEISGLPPENIGIPPYKSLKLKIWLLVLILVLLVSLLIVKVALAPKVAQAQVATSTPLVSLIASSTLDSEIHRLSLKYAVSEALVRKIGRCEGGLYKEAINENWTSRIVGYTNKKEPIYEKYVWSRDWGFLQVNDYYHEADMLKIGLHIKDWHDSLEYGILILKVQGTAPWSASAFCWR